jgi:hypothetical protein
VGGQLEVFTRSFELLDADEYTYTYMENNKHIFIMADADAILSSLRVQVRGSGISAAAPRQALCQDFQQTLQAAGLSSGSQHAYSAVTACMHLGDMQDHNA